VMIVRNGGVSKCVITTLVTVLVAVWILAI